MASSPSRSASVCTGLSRPTPFCSRSILVMTLMVALGITLAPYLALKRGTVVDYAKTVGSVPPLFIYLAFANGAKILQTIRGRKSTFKRTPKQETAAVDAAPVDAEAE
ncbi:hypothetical protein [Methylocystis parvus]|uniref:hypothetical protein n=1 Tax=Methylocystis parvus TaxID=134 RepID=UPI003C7742BD